MTDIFQEVDEALKQEKIEKFWNEYKNTIITAIIVLIGSTAIMSAYQAWNKARDWKQTSLLINAIDSNDPVKELNSFADKARKGHEVIAKMTQASLLLQSGTKENKEKADKIYISIAKQRSAPKDFRNLASILAVRNSIPNDETIKMLKPILKDSKSPLHWHARLEMATFYANHKNNYDKAIEYLTPFEQEKLVPENLKQTAESLLHVYRQKNKS